MPDSPRTPHIDEEQRQSLLRLHDDIALDLEVLGKVEEEVSQLMPSLGEKDPGAVVKRATASMLHDIYKIIESSFQRIGKLLNGGLPDGAEWHKDLLDQMARPLTDVRPSVVTEELRGRLNTYRRFRHVVVHGYGPYLKWGRVFPLVKDVKSLCADYRVQIEDFRNFLRELAGPR